MQYMMFMQGVVTFIPPTDVQDQEGVYSESRCPQKVAIKHY